MFAAALPAHKPRSASCCFHSAAASLVVCAQVGYIRANWKKVRRGPWHVPSGKKGGGAATSENGVEYSVLNQDQKFEDALFAD